MNQIKKIKKFHQFVQQQTGPVNTALVDLLKGNVFQVDNKTIQALQEGDYNKIAAFMDSAEEESLLIEVEPGSWIPELPTLPKDFFLDVKDFEMHVDHGANLKEILKQSKGIPGFSLSRLYYYHHQLPEIPPIKPLPEIILKEKNADECLNKSCIDGNFQKIAETFYVFTQKYNSCWGLNIAVTADNKIRPCIYSEIILGDLYDDGFNGVMEKVKGLWAITKDGIETCKDCELRYTCFDCREIAFRQNNNLYAPNPNCRYNPYEGTWK